jgi:hypothetical protein
MPDLHVFGDEAGNLQFLPKGSRSFFLTTVTLDDPSVSNALIRLRHRLAWEGVETHPEFPPVIGSLDAMATARTVPRGNDTHKAARQKGPVETSGLEPPTPWLQTRCSTS